MDDRCDECGVIRDCCGNCHCTHTLAPAGGPPPAQSRAMGVDDATPAGATRTKDEGTEQK